MPYSSHEELYFDDKIHELSVLLQALGATEVDIIWKKGRSASEIMKDFISEGGDGSFKVAKASANYSKKNEQSQKNQNDRSIHLNVKSEAIHKPFVPEGLVWYETESAWQQMVKQRLLGTTSYSLKVSSKDATSSNSRRANNLKASFKNLILSVNLEYDSECEKMFEEQQETEWIVNIQFRPLSEYKEERSKQIVVEAEEVQELQGNVAPKQLQASDKNLEQVYMEACRSLLGGGQMSDTIRIELNRIRTELGLSSEQTRPIEQAILREHQQEEDPSPKGKPKKPWYWPF